MPSSRPARDNKNTNEPSCSEVVVSHAATEPDISARPERAHSRRHAVNLTALLAGWVLVATGLVFLFKARTGVAPYDVLNSGIANTLDIEIGSAIWLLGTGFLAAAWALGHRPKLGVLAGMLTVGALVNAGIALTGIPTTPLGRAIWAVAGFVTLWAGSTITVASSIGGGPPEFLMVALNRRGIPLAIAGTAISIAAAAAGFLLGGELGVMTVVFAVAFGPALAWSIPRTERLLHRARATTVPL